MNLQKSSSQNKRLLLPHPPYPSQSPRMLQVLAKGLFLDLSLVGIRPHAK